MEYKNLQDMSKGWFVGNFDPSAFKTTDCEVAVKYYCAGESEKSHFHKIATEITVVVSGKIRMMEQEWNSGDIIILYPNEVTSFEALTDAVTTVVKVPSVLNDKYME